MLLERSADFFLQGQAVTILYFVGHINSVVTDYLTLLECKRGYINRQLDKCVLIKLY